METRRYQKRQPTHPGALLREMVLPEIEMTSQELAQCLGISHHALSDIIQERKPITPDIALRLGQFCGNGAKLWLNMQQTYDLWQLEQNHGTEYKQIQKCVVAFQW